MRPARIQFSGVLWLIVGLVLTIHVALRVIPPWRELVQPDGEIVLPGNDEWFHFRQAVFTNENFPRLQRVEDVSRYPEVERVEATGLWNVLIAGLARGATWGEPSREAVAWVCLLLPPIGGALALLLLFFVLRAHSAPVIGAWLVLWGVLNPGSTLTRTGLGFCDHHVAEMVLSLGCLLALLNLLRRTQGERSWWRFAWMEAAPFVVFLFTWVGAPIYLLLTALVLGAAMLTAAATGQRIRPLATVAAQLFGAIVILAAMAAWVWPELVMKERHFRAALIGAALVAAIFPLAGWLLDSAAAKWGSRRAVAIGVGCVVVAAIGGLLFVPAWGGWLHLLLQRKSALVDEHLPVTAWRYFRVTGIAGMLALAAPAIGVLSGAWRRPAWLVTVAWSFGLLLLWWRTWDFDYLATLHALVLAGCALTAWQNRRESNAKSAALPIGACVIISVVTFLLSWPLGIAGTMHAPAMWYRESGVMAHAGWREAMRWLRALPPPPSPDFSQRLPRGPAGVLTEWSSGNLVNTLGGWPAMVARYPDANAATPLWFESEEAVRAAAWGGSTLGEVTRFVVLDARLLGDWLPASWQLAGREQSEFLEREILDDPVLGRTERSRYGAKLRATFAHRLVVGEGSGLAHFRLIFESTQEVFIRQLQSRASGKIIPLATLLRPPLRREDIAGAVAAGAWTEEGLVAHSGHIVPSVRIYEQVPGARLTGRAEPDATVVGQMLLKVGATGREFIYTQSTRCGADGAFVLVVPYATERSDGTDVRALGPASVRGAGRQWMVNITDEHVRRGEVVALPADEAKR